MENNIFIDSDEDSEFVDCSFTHKDIKVDTHQEYIDNNEFVELYRELTGNEDVELGDVEDSELFGFIKKNYTHTITHQISIDDIPKDVIYRETIEPVMFYGDVKNINPNDLDGIEYIYETSLGVLMDKVKTQHPSTTDDIEEQIKHTIKHQILPSYGDDDINPPMDTNSILGKKIKKYVEGNIKYLPKIVKYDFGMSITTNGNDILEGYKKVLDTLGKSTDGLPTQCDGDDIKFISLSKDESSPDYGDEYLDIDYDFNSLLENSYEYSGENMMDVEKQILFFIEDEIDENLFDKIDENFPSYLMDYSNFYWDYETDNITLDYEVVIFIKPTELVDMVKSCLSN